MMMLQIEPSTASGNSSEPLILATDYMFNSIDCIHKSIEKKVATRVETSGGLGLIKGQGWTRVVGARWRQERMKERKFPSIRKRHARSLQRGNNR
jgi:hypothetical protein